MSKNIEKGTPEIIIIFVFFIVVPVLIFLCAIFPVGILGFLILAVVILGSIFLFTDAISNMIRSALGKEKFSSESAKVLGNSIVYSSIAVSVMCLVNEVSLWYLFSGVVLVCLLLIVFTKMVLIKNDRENGSKFFLSYLRGIIFGAILSATILSVIFTYNSHREKEKQAAMQEYLEKNQGFWDSLEKGDYH